jgi:hypothetical protein
MYGYGLLVALGLLAAVAPVRAGEVFKSVDADGHVVYSDHADPSAQSTVVHLEDAYVPPRVIHFCWTNCFTLELDNGAYRRVDGTDETWTVERFTPASFLLHRHDAPAAWNGFSADVAYEGRIESEQLFNVTVGGRPVNDIQAAWGGALETLPGSNAERDQRNAPQAAMDSPPSPMDAEVTSAEAPPPLQDETQSTPPDEGDLWTPGYWAWGGGYYWVPGIWVRPPRIGLLWTPGYWAFAPAGYVFHPGYWAPHVGYYGGINYGFGYPGAGSGKVSYNGGPGGITASPTAEQRALASEPHVAPTPLQRQFAQRAAGTSPLQARTEVIRSEVVRPAAATVHNSRPVKAGSAPTVPAASDAAARPAAESAARQAVKPATSAAAGSAPTTHTPARSSRGTRPQ